MATQRQKSNRSQRTAAARATATQRTAGRRGVVEHASVLPITKYHQIYLVLQQQLSDGVYAQGLPPEIELAQQFGVGRITVRRALQLLTEEGRIVRTAGRGTKPVETAPGVCDAEPGAGGAAAPATGVRGLLGSILEASKKTSIQLLEWRYVVATGELAQALQVPPGSKVRKMVRIRRNAGGPVSFITSYLPAAYVQGIQRADAAKSSMLELLSAAGTRWGTTRQTISACQADTLVAHHLQVALGAALLSVRRLVLDHTGQPVQLLHGLYRPDRYEYQMEMSEAGAVEARIQPLDLHA